MKSKDVFVYLILVLSLLISSCSKEEGKGDYSGVSDLIADRNRARYQVAEKPSQRKITQKKLPQTAKPVIPTPTPKEEEISTVVLYEQKIEIIGQESGKTIAKGTAYINKQGQIVRITIVR